MLKFVGILCLALLFSMPMAAQTVDPCTQDTQLTGGTTFTNTGGGSKPLSGSPYSYEISTNSGNAVQLTWYGTNQGGGAAFSATWTNPTGGFLGRVGYYWNQGKPYTDYENVYCDFNFTRSDQNTGGSYSYIGIYGWTQTPLVEYYIVEDWFGNQWQSETTPVGPSTICGGNCSSIGTLTVDGGTYDIYTNTRVNQPSITGNNATFTQIFSVRRTPRKCGTISVTEHYKKWAELGLLGSNMYECKFLVEVGGGTGWFNASYLTFYQEDQPITSINAPSVETSKMYVNVLSNSDLNVNFTAVKDGEVELRLYCLTGALVASANLQTVAGKNYSYTFNQRKLPSGVYAVWMHGNGSIEQTKVIIP